jgi:hypothetical protein
MVYILPYYNNSKLHCMSQIVEDDEVTDVNDPEYNRLLDDATKTHRTSKDKIIEAARRLEDLG